MERRWWCVVAALVVAVSPAVAQSNPRGPVNGTRAYPGAGLRELHGVAWTAKPGFRDFGAIAVSVGVVISGNVSGKGGTYAFDEATGQKLWSAPGHLKGGPAVDGVAAYTVNSVDGNSFALSRFELRTGKRAWSVEGVRFGTFEGAPLAGGSAVYLVNDDGSVMALDAASGETLWTRRYSPHHGHCPTAPSSADGILYFGGGHQPGPNSQGLFLWALDAATGEERWRFQAKPESYSRDGECVSAPAVADGVVVTTAWNILYALDAATGKLKWQQEIRRPVEGRDRRRTLSDPVIADGVVYSYFQEGIAGWDLETGRPVFAYEGDYPAEQHRHLLAVADGVVYFTANFEVPRSESAGNGYLYALDLKSKQLLWKQKTSTEGWWQTQFFLPAPGAVYYESAGVLVKLR